VKAEIEAGEVLGEDFDTNYKKFIMEYVNKLSNKDLGSS
jgi:hypothetical protein